MGVTHHLCLGAVLFQAVGALSFEAAFPLPNEGQLLMTIFELDQVEEKLLAHQIADEALEMAAGSKPAANYTLFYCTALDLCPGP